MIEDRLPELGPSTVLIAILETIGKVDVPIMTLLDSGKEEKELQVDYNTEDQSVTFKLRGKNE
jgi:hypothetical protein